MIRTYSVDANNPIGALRRELQVGSTLWAGTLTDPLLHTLGNEEDVEETEDTATKVEHSL